MKLYLYIKITPQEFSFSKKSFNCKVQNEKIERSSVQLFNFVHTPVTIDFLSCKKIYLFYTGKA